ncbi:MAG: VIT domain-containing protein, partial [Verrucomicrobiota bacterium]
MKRCLLLAGLLLSIPILPFPIAQADGLIVVTDLQMLPAPGSQGPPSWPHPLPSPRRIYRFAPLEVTYHHVDVHIKDQISVTSVDQEFYNPNAHELEGTYLFPVPKGAHIDRFSMEIGGRQVEAELLPAAKARKLYEDIVRNLKDPALLEYAGRELFKVRVFPIEPHSRKRIKVSYSQLLKTESGLVSYVYPLNTEKFSARPIKNVSVQIKLETRRPIKALYSPSHPVDIRRHGATRAQITYEASQTKPDTDLQLLFAAEDSEVGLHLLTSKGNDRDSGGYFLLLASPGKAEKAELVSKDVVFVLDTSGSMAGTKLDQAKKALQFCVENLREQDRFEIIRFATETEPLFEEVKPATSENQKRAFDFIRNLKPIGGTAIEPALRKALTLRKAGSDRPFIVIFLTDGRPTVGPTHEDEILSSVRKAGEGNTRIFCFGIGHDVNTHLLDRITEETRAFSQYVLPEEDLELKLSSFFSRINAPVLSDLLIHFPDGMRAKSLYPSNLPDLYHGDQLVIVGRFDGPATGRAKLE